MQIKSPLNKKHIIGLVVMALLAYLAAEYSSDIFSEEKTPETNQQQTNNDNTGQNKLPENNNKEKPNLGTTKTTPSNSLMVIAPYKDKETGAWVFDDAKKGLEKEPFVSGIPEMIEVLVKDVPNAEQGFRLIFSASSFPDYGKSLTWTHVDEEGTGNYYMLDGTKLEGWLCPALLKYFDKPPRKLYVKAEEKK